MGVLVDNVNLDVDEFVEFVYMNATVQSGSGNPAFVVAVDGGAGPGVGAMDVTPVPSDALEVSVGDASSGSGTAMLAPPTQAVTRNSLGNELIFIYTPGWHDYGSYARFPCRSSEGLVRADRQYRRQGHFHR